MAGLSRGGERADERVPHRPLVQPARPARVLGLERRQQRGEGGELKTNKLSRVPREILTSSKCTLYGQWVCTDVWDNLKGDPSGQWKHNNFNFVS